MIPPQPVHCGEWSSRWRAVQQALKFFLPGKSVTYSSQNLLSFLTACWVPSLHSQSIAFFAYSWIKLLRNAEPQTRLKPRNKVRSRFRTHQSVTQRLSMSGMNERMTIFIKAGQLATNNKGKSWPKSQIPGSWQTQGKKRNSAWSRNCSWHYMLTWKSHA